MSKRNVITIDFIKKIFKRLFKYYINIEKIYKRQ